MAAVEPRGRVAPRAVAPVRWPTAKAAVSALVVTVAVLAVLIAVGLAGLGPAAAAPGPRTGAPGATPGAVQSAPQGESAQQGESAPQAEPAPGGLPDASATPARPEAGASATAPATPDTATPKPPPPRRTDPTPPTPGRAAESSIRVTTSDVILTDSYWAQSGSLADLAVTVSNTGGLPQRVQLSYSLPASVRDANADGCAAVQDSVSRCPPRQLAPGASSIFRARVRVTADAWRRMPLAGKVTVAATTPERDDLRETSTERNFAVLFPAGPPTPGMALSAGEVDLVPDSGTSGALDIRLGNTGDTDAAGSIEAVLPAGLRVTTVPAGCQQAGTARLRCDLGSVPAGESSRIRLPVAGKVAPGRLAPLAGAVFAVLQPADGGPREMRSSFRVLLADRASAAATDVPSGLPQLAGASAPPSTPPGPPAVGARAPGWSDKLDAATLVGVVAGVTVLALLLATASLRRRFGDPGDPPVRPGRSRT